MMMINQELVDNVVVEVETGHRAGVLDKTKMWEGVPVPGKFDRDLQRLILARLVRVRREEDG